MFDIPSTFVQEFNNTNVERISENGDKNPQAYKTINRTTGNTRFVFVVKALLFAYFYIH